MKQILRPALGCFLLVMPSVAWILIDDSVWTFDPAAYGEWSLRLYSLQGRPFPDWLSGMVDPFISKAPGIAWYGQLFAPLGRVLGDFDDALLLMIVFCAWLSTLLLYRYLRDLLSGDVVAASLGALLMASAPLFVAMSQAYFVEIMQVLAVIWIMLISRRASQWPPTFSLFQLFGAGMFGMAVKVTTPLYVFAPALLTILVIVSRRERPRVNEAHIPRWLWVATIVTCSATAGATIGWYTMNLGALTSFARQASSGDLALYYGSGRPFIEKLSYWLASAETCFYVAGVWWVWFAILIAGGTSPLRQDVSLQSRLQLFCAIVEICATLTVFSLQVNEETRYLLPMLPYVVVLVATAVSRLRAALPRPAWRVLFGAAVTLVALRQAVIVQQVNFGLLGRETARVSFWLSSPSDERKAKAAIKDAIAASCSSNSTVRTHIVGVNWADFNASTFAYYRQHHFDSSGGQCRFASLGFMETDVERAWTVVMSAGGHYLAPINLPRSKPLPGGPEAVDVEIFNRVRASDAFTQGRSDGLYLFTRKP